MPTSLPDKHHPGVPGLIGIVGLGASAGGLEALDQFLSHVPARTGLAYVVVQHLDPTHDTVLVELLQRVTSMSVREAAESMPVQPDFVYIIPPNSELSVLNGVLHLARPAQPRGMRLPIDVLFSSLARDQSDRAIGVVLSGMGSDGTLGLQAIKSQGGLTLAQQPESAQFDSMPKNAIASGCTDIVALPAEMAQHILRVVAARRAAPPGSVESDEAGERALGAILGLLHERSKHDLSLYKPSTLKRRVERRVGVHGLGTMQAYEEFLHHNPRELDLLFKEMLIGVTSFFRDPEIWQELKNEVLPALLAEAPAGGNLRAWVVACSTGEEAYSLAMLFREVADTLPAPNQHKLQIFATDLNADAIAVARIGHYPAGIARDMAPERLARFFTEHREGYLIAKEIREMVLFAQHDVILDPPFTKLDILSCRNLLIYFSAALQRRLVPLFHYSLRPGGVLVLGGSETVGRARALFMPLRPRSRLYQRSDSMIAAGSVEFPVTRRVPSRTPAQESKVSQMANQPVNLQSLADQVLLQTYSPPAVLVNESGDIVYVSGRTGKYLEPAAGKANWNIHVMARRGIRAQLTSALRRALQEKLPVELRDLQLEDEAERRVDVSVQAIREPKALDGLLMIVFRDVAAQVAGATTAGQPGEPVDPAARIELARANDEVRALRQEMRESEEELQAANEELQSTNEELQSANEELTTSKEESQSMNEELQTINSELQARLDDLALAQSDMQNLLNSTDIATLFLDSALNVRRFTERITRIIHLRDSDVGRPLNELASTLVYPELHADAKETLRTLVFSEKQISTTDDHWFTVRIMPYRTLSNVIQGLVITFVDITVSKALEARLRKG